MERWADLRCRLFGSADESSFRQLFRKNEPHILQSACAVMKLMFGGDLHHDTVEKIQSSVFFDDFKKYRAQALDILGGDFYFAKPNFLVDGKRVPSSSETKFLMMGSAPSDMAFTRNF